MHQCTRISSVYTKPIAGKAALKRKGSTATIVKEIYTKPIAGKAALKPSGVKHNALIADTKPIAGKAALKRSCVQAGLK